MTFEEARTGIVNGRAVFPSLYERQNALVEMMIDTSLELTVYEELKAGAGLVNMQRQGLLRDSVSESTLVDMQKEAEAAINRKKPDNTPDDAAIRKGLLDILKTLRNSGHLAQAQDLCDPTTTAMQCYPTGLEAFYAERSVFLEKQTVGMHEGKAPKKPQDPRIKEMNANYTSMWIQIKDQGAKSDQRSEKKAGDKGVEKNARGDFPIGGALRDLARITVMPRSPSVAADFFALLRDKYPPHPTREGNLDRVFVEDWALKQSGYFDQTAYIAQGETIENARLRQSGRTKGLVAEIKVVGREMEKADYISHPIYEAVRKVRMDQLFPRQQKDDNATFKAHRRHYAAVYEALRNEFVEKAKEKQLSYAFPEFDTTHINDRNYFHQLVSDLTELRRTIHVDGVNRETSPEFAQAYLQTAYATEVALNNGRKAGKKRFLPEMQLARVGKDYVIDHRALRNHAYAVHNGEKTTTARDK